MGMDLEAYTRKIGLVEIQLPQSRQQLIELCKVCISYLDDIISQHQLTQSTRKGREGCYLAAQAAYKQTTPQRCRTCKESCLVNSGRSR